MCESTVWLLKGSERVMIISEAARVIVTGDNVTCIDTFGERKVVPDSRLSEANLLGHEILLKERKS